MIINAEDLQDLQERYNVSKLDVKIFLNLAVF